MKKAIIILALQISSFVFSQKETKYLSEKNISGFSNYVNAIYKETTNIEKQTIIKYVDIAFYDERYKTLKTMDDFILLDEETKNKFIEDLKKHILKIELKSDSNFETSTVTYMIETNKDSKFIYITDKISNAYFSLSVKNSNKLINFLQTSILEKDVINK